MATSQRTSPKGRTVPDTVYKDVLLGPSAIELADDGDDGTMTFDVIASDETVDRYDDIIRADGWQLDNFKANPIILRQHNHTKPVGTAPDVWVDGTELHATITMAAEGTSTDVDETRALVSQKVLRTVSVGFTPVDYKWIDGGWGIEFLEHELTEISIVSVPANPSATIQLAHIARAVGVPDDRLPGILERFAVPVPQRTNGRPRVRDARSRLLDLA